MPRSYRGAVSLSMHLIRGGGGFASSDCFLPMSHKALISIRARTARKVKDDDVLIWWSCGFPVVTVAREREREKVDGFVEGKGLATRDAFPSFLQLFLSNQVCFQYFSYYEFKKAS